MDDIYTLPKNKRRAEAVRRFKLITGENVFERLLDYLELSQEEFTNEYGDKLVEAPHYEVHEIDVPTNVKNVEIQPKEGVIGTGTVTITAINSGFEAKKGKIHLIKELENANRYDESIINNYKFKFRVYIDRNADNNWDDAEKFDRELSPKKIKNDNEFIWEWESDVINWKENKNLPLIVRKGSGIRGSELVHITGRRIIITDNSFSQWVYSNVLDGIVYSLDDIDKMLKNDEIPMCFARKKEDANKIKFKKVLGNYSVNKRGWKLCHIDSVGLNSKAPIQKIDINELEKHFIKLGNPQNMFLLPLEIGSLGEIQEFIEEQKD